MSSLQSMAKEAKKKKKSVKPKKPVKEIQPASNLSAEFVQDSDEDEVAKPVNKRSSDDDSLPTNAAPVKIKANGKVATATGSNLDESESEDSSEAEDEPSVSAKKTSSVPVPSSQNEKDSRTVTFQKPAPYKPPTGFEHGSIDSDPKSSKLFKKSNLEGKQIWHITAPASIPFSSIEKISLRDIEKGKKVLEHDGNDYGFVQDAAEVKTYSKIMTPNSADDGYRTVFKSVDQILHLQQIVQLPGVKDRAASSLATVPAKKPVRQQPSGLKMRFLPIGFGEGKAGKIGSSSSSADESGSESESDDEMADAATAFQKPVPFPAELSSSDDSDDDASSSDVEMADVPPPSSKKTSKSKPMVETPVTVEGTKKRKHSEGANSKAKNSSSQSTITTDHKQLKKIKTKQTESQKTMADSRSASTEPCKTNPNLPPSRLASSPIPTPCTPKPSKTSTPILPPTALSAIRPAVKTTSVQPAKILPPTSSQSPTKDVKPKLSLKEQITAIDSSLSTEEREREVKRLKRNEASRLSKARRRSLLTDPVGRDVEPKSTPVPAKVTAVPVKVAPIPSQITPVPPPQRSFTPLKTFARNQNVVEPKPNSKENQVEKKKEETKEERRERKRAKKEKNRLRKVAAAAKAA